METVTASSVLLSIVCIVVVTVLIKLVNWVWLKPKKLEKLLRQHGFSGTSYKFLFGDMKEFISMHAEALKNPMDGFSHDYFPRVEPLWHQLATKFGIWSNPLQVKFLLNLVFLIKWWAFSMFMFLYFANDLRFLGLFLVHKHFLGFRISCNTLTLISEFMII